MIYGLAQFFDLFNIVFIGTSISIFVVSYFIYKPFDEVNYESDTDEDEFYEYKYLEDYYDLLDKKLKLKEEENQDEGQSEEEQEESEGGDEEEQEESEEEEEDEEEDDQEDDEPYEENEDLVSLKDNFIEENTPRGIIYMAYDNTIESYIYYSKTKDIHYKYLESVARKYVIDNKCLNIYVDYKEEYIQGLNKYKQRLQKRKELLENKMKEQEQKQEEDNVENKKKNIFANFKSYNKQDKGTKNNTDTNTKEYILTENSNHYKYKGNLDDYEKMLKEKVSQESVLKEYEQIDFKAYKNMIKKND
mgnify:CR=1 FL=1|tara:strand:- start:2230 stop:3141 length:912 start_codon:yes stop_codon:yes gene_type:complete